jgi:hypothetical protein
MTSIIWMAKLRDCHDIFSQWSILAWFHLVNSLYIIQSCFFGIILSNNYDWGFVCSAPRILDKQESEVTHWGCRVLEAKPIIIVWYRNYLVM